MRGTLGLRRIASAEHRNAAALMALIKAAPAAGWKAVDDTLYSAVTGTATAACTGCLRNICDT